MLLTSRKLLQSKLLDIENELRGTLKNFGLKVGSVSKGQFEARTRELGADQSGPTCDDPQLPSLSF